MKKVIICLAGRTGAGKDTSIRPFYNQYFNGKKLTPIVSYTSRPKRPNEQNGIEHIFLTKEELEEHKKNDDMVGYTKIGEYEYFTTTKQFKDFNLYIVDPDGIDYLFDTVDEEETDVVVIYIWSPKWMRRRRFIKRSNLPKDQAIKEFDKREQNENTQFSRIERTGCYHFRIVNLDYFQRLTRKKLVRTINRIAKTRG